VNVRTTDSAQGDTQGEPCIRSNDPHMRKSSKSRGNVAQRLIKVKLPRRVAF